MDKELIGKCYKRELTGKYIEYNKIIDTFGNDDDLLNCHVTNVTFWLNRPNNASIETSIGEHTTLVARGEEISNEEFAAAYDKALNIINEYRKQL